MRNAITLLTFLCLGAFFFGCTKKEEIDTNEKVLRLAISQGIKGYDPIFANDLYSANEIARVYEGLFEFHYLKRPYELAPNLAAKMPEVSDNGMTYTFTLKEGIYFQDDACFPNNKGRELKAKDVVYSLKRVADPKLQSTGWWLFDGKIQGLNDWREAQSNSEKANYDSTVNGLKTTGEYTLEITLAKPFPQFLYGLAMPFSFVVARECVEHYGKEFLNHPVGTGAFKKVGPYMSQSKKIVYEKNPTFRKKLYPSEGTEEFKKAGLLADAGKTLPLVNKVEVDIITEEAPRWLNFTKGKVDYLGIPKDNFDTAITPSKELAPDFTKKGISLIKEPSLDVTYIAFNHHYKLFRDNLKLRQAMSLAYDGEEANTKFYNGNAIVAQSIVPPKIAGHIKGYQNPYKQYNLERAKKLLAEAGYPGGKGLPEIIYDTASSTTSLNMAQYFKRAMSELGIKIKIGTYPFPELQKRIATKKSMTYGIAWGADYPDAENFLQLLYGPNKSPGANGSNYDNSEYNSLFEKAVKMQDGPVRTALYEKLYRMAAEEVPWIYGVHRMSFVLYHGWLKNFAVSDFDAGQAQYLDVDLKKKSELLKSKF